MHMCYPHTRHPITHTICHANAFQPFRIAIALAVAANLSNSDADDANRTLSYV